MLGDFPNTMLKDCSGRQVGGWPRRGGKERGRVDSGAGMAGAAGAGGGDLGAAYGETLRQLRAMIGAGAGAGARSAAGAPGSPAVRPMVAHGVAEEWQSVELEWEGDLGIELWAPPGMARLKATQGPEGDPVVTVVAPPKR